MRFNGAFSDGHVEWHSGLMIDKHLALPFCPSAEGHAAAPARLCLYIVLVCFSCEI